MTKANRLEKWKIALNKCIRCGYCYEHCPIYKSTRWEIDSPRGKLVLLYGMLNGELEPSGYIANKLFECFHCGRCQKACSSGVPTLDIFADAKAYFLEKGFDAVGTTSQTNRDVCALCLSCVRICKHEARSYVDGKIVTDRLKCQSCGSCIDICPARGITIERGYGTSPDELVQQAGSFFNNRGNPNAKAIIFSCGWSIYPGFQSAQYDQADPDPEYRVLVTACSGRLNTRTILETLELGAWGILVCCCPEDECEHGGSKRIKMRIKSLNGTLEKIGIDPKRIQVLEVPQGNQKKFADTVKVFMDQTRAMGPLLSGGEK